MLVVNFKRFSIQTAIGAQSADDVPMATTAPFDDLSRRIPTVEQNIDRIIIRKEGRDVMQHGTGQADFAAKFEPLPFGTLAIEPSDGFFAHVELHIDGETEGANVKAKQDKHQTIGVNGTTGTAFRVIVMPIDPLQMSGRFVFGRQTVV